MDRNVVQEPFITRPHVVILGAGASKAALPAGDLNGKKLPLMNDLVEVCDVQRILDKYGITESVDNFESLYSSLCGASETREAVDEIEAVVHAYFTDLRLPTHPTLYDHLVLSLRPKDVIVTFNWDPFLVQAAHRNAAFASVQGTKLPTTLFLHGNVAFGYCMRHSKTCIGLLNETCRECGEVLQPSRLLYPVQQKGYDRNPFICKMWEFTQRFLRRAYMVTFFGYSAPKTDVEAVEMLKSGWGDPSSRDLEEIEIIDLKDEAELAQTWSPFIFEGHYTCTNSFHNSTIFNHPRRSCDAMFRQFMDAEWIDSNPIPSYQGLDELHSWLVPLIEDERNFEIAS